jgi:type IV secretory pathway VirB2 component (pilin)
MSNLISKAKLAFVGAATAGLTLITSTQAALAQSGATDSIRNNFRDVTDGAFGDGTADSAPSLAELVGNIIQYLLGLLGIILVVLVIYAGVLWMTAGGNKDSIGKAQKIILNAAIGMIIIFAAYAITDFVIRAVEAL